MATQGARNGNGELKTAILKWLASILSVVVLSLGGWVISMQVKVSSLEAKQATLQRDLDRLESQLARNSSRIQTMREAMVAGGMLSPGSP